MQIIGVLNKGILFIHRFDCERVSDKSKKYILEWDWEKINELEKTYLATLIITINSQNLKINPIVHFITSKGFELYGMDTNLKDEDKIITIRIQMRNFDNLKWLINELTYKFEEITNIKIK